MQTEDMMMLILLEEEEDEDLLLQQLRLRKRIKTDNIFKKRTEEGYFNLLIRSHLDNNEVKFREFFRLNRRQFDFVLSLINDDIRKPGSNFVQYPILPKEKLALTLRYLATGESFRSLAFAFRISHSYISVIIRETLKAIRTRLVPLFIPVPTVNSLQESATEFWQRWNFPNCVSAIDGKHIRMICPAKSGSLYFNYKDYFSIVLLALVDANYKFMILDVGSYGKEGDSSIFNKSVIGRKIILDSKNFFPADKYLPNSNKKLPHVIIGDEAFRLDTHIMKPFNKTSANSDKAKAIYNYRLSRARRVTENAFGLLCQVFRIFYTPIAVKPDTCDDLIISACCLHNLLRNAYLENNGRPYYEYEPNNKQQAKSFSNLTRSGGFQNAEGFTIREQFAKFFNEEGIVTWQDNHVCRI